MRYYKVMGIRWGNTYLDYKGIKMGYITKNVIWGIAWHITGINKQQYHIMYDDIWIYLKMGRGP